jgi:hypothetical protein
MPAARRESTASRVISQGWIRPIATWTEGSKSWTPRLTRLTPIARKAANSPGPKCLGSISTAVSVCGPVSKRAARRAVTRASRSPPSALGVPPPQWI